jgi:hypothetical protein
MMARPSIPGTREPRHVHPTDGWSLEHGSYYLRRSGRILTMTQEPALCFTRSADGCQLLKQGDRTSVEAFAAKRREQGRLAPELASALGEVCVLSSEHWPVDDLNRLATNPSLLPQFLERT